MRSLYIIRLNIIFELICCWEQDPSSSLSSSAPYIRTFSLMYCSCLPSWKTIIYVFWTISMRSCIFTSTGSLRLFSCYALFVCIPFGLFSRFYVRSVSFSFMFLMACQTWLKISSVEVYFSHVASFISFFVVRWLPKINRPAESAACCRLIVWDTVLVKLSLTHLL